MESVNKVISLFAIVMCLVLAYYVKFEDLTAGKMPESRKNILVVILIAYALFRTYRFYKMIKK